MHPDSSILYGRGSSYSTCICMFSWSHSLFLLHPAASNEGGKRIALYRPVNGCLQLPGKRSGRTVESTDRACGSRDSVSQTTAGAKYKNGIYCRKIAWNQPTDIGIDRRLCTIKSSLSDTFAHITSRSPLFSNPSDRHFQKMDRSFGGNGCRRLGLHYAYRNGIPSKKELSISGSQHSCRLVIGGP